MSIIDRIINKLPITATKKLIVQNLFWAILGKFTNLLCGLVIGALVARYLGPKQYGLMNYVISYVFLFQTFATLGLDAIEIREESKGDVPYPTIIGTAFRLKLVFGALLMMAVYITSLITEADLYTTILVLIYSFSIILNSFNVIRNYFTAIVQNEYVVKAEISRALLSAFIKGILLLLHAPLVFFIFTAMFDFFLLATGYSMAYIKQIGKIKEWHYDRAYAYYLLKESFPLLLTNAAVIIYQRIDQVMIGQMIDKTSVGYFAVASQFTEVLIYIPMMLAQTIMPILVKAREKGIAEYRLKSQQFMNISLWSSLLLSILTSICAYWIVRLTFGTAYLPSVIILQVMAFKAASVAMSNTAGAMLITEGLQRMAIFRDILGCIVCVVLNYLMLPHYGIIAAAYIAILSNISAGYLADALIPAYRHIFIQQTKALLLGWRDILKVKNLIKQHPGTC